MEDVTETDYPTRTVLALAAAWSPNPARPPLFFDLPNRDEVIKKWEANAPISMLERYAANLVKLRAIALDAGSKDPESGPGTERFAQALRVRGISSAFEVYDGDHTSGISERFGTKVIPFFASNLSFGS
jgi:hypothetical protein